MHVLTQRISDQSTKYRNSCIYIKQHILGLLCWREKLSARLHFIAQNKTNGRHRQPLYKKKMMSVTKTMMMTTTTTKRCSKQEFKSRRNSEININIHTFILGNFISTHIHQITSKKRTRKNEMEYKVKKISLISSNLRN